MTMSADGWRAGRPGARRATLRVGTSLLGGFAVAILATAVHADTFADAHYDAGKDQIVVTMIYRGTNPDHTFSLKWGRCKQSPDGSAREIVAEVLDSQWQDAETQDFRKTTRISLDNMRCRPAKLTLRSAPRFFYTLQIPARAGAAP
ncbi:MAG: hypothetical protein ACYDBZ_06000 [Steroidobacteraceae bacterium]